MRRSFWLGLVALGAAAAAATTVHPQRWAAARLAAEIGRQLAAGDASALAAVAAEAAPALRPYLEGGHLAAAAAPLRGARLAAAHLVRCAAGQAEAVLTYADGRKVHLTLAAGSDGRWQLTALT
jgi:hypothetical protein